MKIPKKGNTKHPLVEKICPYCKKKFIVLRTPRIRKYCSKKCASLVPHSGTFKKGHPNYLLRHTEKTKMKISKAQKGKPNWYQKRNVPHPSWKGGISKVPNYHREKYKEWVNKNREYKYFLNMRRRVMKIKAEGSHTFGEWQTLKAQYNWTCPACRKQEPKIRLTEDHIIPLIKGGSDNIENIQPLCRSCNSIKHTKIIFYVI